MAASETARLIAELTLSDKLTPGVNKALGSVGRLETGMQRATRGAGQVASGFAKAGTRIATGVVVGLAGAAKAAIDWEDAFTGVVKTVDASESDLAKLADDLRRMATEGPTTANELARIAEAAGAMGVGFDEATGKTNTAAIAAFTKQVAILGATTNVTVDDAATALGQLTNVLDLQAGDFDNFSAALVDLGNKGASTEAQILEIARRSGGAAKLFGIAKEETLGWASAAANLGLNEELAGTALQNVFVKLLPKFQKGAKDLQEVTGMTGRQLKKAFKEDAGGAVEGLIAQLGAMPKDKRLAAVQDLFGKGSGITRLVLGLADSYEKNLAPALETSTEAWEEATAAQIEFEKRNATVRSAFARLKNGVIDAGISLGEGFAPALGRAATKLSDFLKMDENRNALKAIGEDIGKAIDDIDWKEVVDGAKSLVDVMKTALDFAKRLYDAFNLLPTPLKVAAVGLVGLDKLSGGLIGSGLGGIVGGLGSAVAKSLAASVPLFGRAFVQPVFVTNMGAGGLGGAGGAAGGGLLGAGATVGSLVLPAAVIAAVSGAAVAEVNKQMQTVGFEGKFENPFGGGLLNFGQNVSNLATLIPQFVDAITGATDDPPARDTNISDPRDRRGPATPTISDPRDSRPIEKKLEVVHTALENQRKEEQVGRAVMSQKQAAIALMVQRQGERQTASVRDSKIVLAAKAAETARKAAEAGRTSANASTTGANRTVAAINAIPAPVVNVRVSQSVSVSSVIKKTTVVKRYGTANGSRNQDGNAGSGDPRL